MGDFAEIKDRIRQLRIAHGWSQQELAEKLGVTNVAVSQWERGVKQPKLEMREALCDLFNVNMEYLNGNWDKISRLVTEEEASILDKAHSEKKQEYYTDPETAKIAQEIFDDKNMRILFDAASGSNPEDLKMAADLLKRLKGNANGGED